MDCFFSTSIYHHVCSNIFVDFASFMGKISVQNPVLYQYVSDFNTCTIMKIDLEITSNLTDERTLQCSLHTFLWLNS